MANSSLRRRCHAWPSFVVSSMPVMLSSIITHNKVIKHDVSACTVQSRAPAGGHAAAGCGGR